MLHRNWLKRLQFHMAEKGGRIGLRIYVYPDGHGPIQHISPSGKIDEENCPVNNVDEAASMFRELWRRTSEAKSR